MIFNMRKLLILSLFAMAAFNLSAQPTGFGGFQMPKVDVRCSEKVADVDYAGDGEVYHKLDIYYPKVEKASYPVVVHIYGSAWFSNNSKGMADLGTIVNALLDAGYAVVTPNHRSSMDAKFPAQIHDIKGVIPSSPLPASLPAATCLRWRPPAAASPRWKARWAATWSSPPAWMPPATGPVPWT